jgi:hypothetical protein
VRTVSTGTTALSGRSLEGERASGLESLRSERAVADRATPVRPPRPLDRAGDPARPASQAGPTRRTGTPPRSRGDPTGPRDSGRPSLRAVGALAEPPGPGRGQPGQRRTRPARVERRRSVKARSPVSTTAAGRRTCGRGRPRRDPRVESWASGLGESSGVGSRPPAVESDGLRDCRRGAVDLAGRNPRSGEADRTVKSPSPGRAPR